MLLGTLLRNTLGNILKHTHLGTLIGTHWVPLGVHAGSLHSLVAKDLYAFCLLFFYHIQTSRLMGGAEIVGDIVSSCVCVCVCVCVCAPVKL